MSNLFSAWGVIPPYEGQADAPDAFSPYQWAPERLVQTLGFSSERRDLLENLFEYRRRLRSVGVEGIQWLDGSFTEDCERLKGRSPGDIDLMNLVFSPDRERLGTEGVRLLMDRAFIKESYHLDVMQPFPLGLDGYGRPMVGLHGLTYFFSLFSHARPEPYGIPVWKGMIELALSSDDNEDREAIQLLAQGDPP